MLAAGESIASCDESRGGVDSELDLPAMHLAMEARIRVDSELDLPAMHLAMEARIRVDSELDLPAMHLTMEARSFGGADAAPAKGEATKDIERASQSCADMGRKEG